MNNIDANTTAAGAVGSWTPAGETPPKPNEDAVIAACQTVYDPEIPVNIYELGLIYAIEIGDDRQREGGDDADRAGLPERAGTAGAGARGDHGHRWRVECDVDVVWDPPWDPSRMSDDARLALNMF